jgi:hypothetical protein
LLVPLQFVLLHLLVMQLRLLATLVRHIAGHTSASLTAC